MAYPNGKVNAMIDGHGGSTSDFTRSDWLELALAALDQAGGRGRAYDVAFDAVKELAEEERDEEPSS